MILKILNTILVLGAAFMAMKQGWAMFVGKNEMLELFAKWGFGRIEVQVNGAITILSALLILYPKTFVWGNFLMSAGILLIICFQIFNQDLRGVFIELPFLLLNMVILYLNYPLKLSQF